MSQRLANHTTASAELARLTDHALADLLAQAPSAGAGIGGASSTMDMNGVQVFVKRIPLTDRETQQSTANVFTLPVFCQYGLGSPGTGVWRELAAHIMTTNWVLKQKHEGFPLLYHWRVLPTPSGEAALPEELADVDKVVEYWCGSEAVRDRIEAIRRSSASVVLFMEHLPHTLAGWLKDHQDTESLAMVEAGLLSGTSFMNDHGLLHFDAHFENILTDGSRLYFADFGLALSSQFELSPAEKPFFAEHRTYDRAYTLTALVRRLLAAQHGEEGLDARVRGAADPVGLPEAAKAIVKRYAPVAGVVGQFYAELRESRATQYPAAEIERVLRVCAPGRPG